MRLGVGPGSGDDGEGEGEAIDPAACSPIPETLPAEGGESSPAATDGAESGAGEAEGDAAARR